MSAEERMLRHSSLAPTRLSPCVTVHPPVCQSLRVPLKLLGELMGAEAGHKLNIGQGWSEGKKSGAPGIWLWHRANVV